MVLVAAACGGGDDGTVDLPDVAETVEATDAPSQDGTDAGSESPTADAPGVDPSAMPPPGEAHLSVDGQTYVFRLAEEESFACDLGDDEVNVNIQFSGPEVFNLLVLPQGDGTVAGSVTVIPEGSEARFDSGTGGGSNGTVAIEPPHVLYESRFDATPIDDLANVEDVGRGTLAVTCP